MGRLAALALIAVWALPAAAEAPEALSLGGSAVFQSLSGGLGTLPATVIVVPRGRPVPPFHEQAVSFSADDGYALRGKVALPQRYGPLTPAFVLVHGSGAADMDGTTSADTTTDGKPGRFLEDISDALARAGYVVLRYDKRGFEGFDAHGRPLPDEDSYLASPPERLADDAAAAVRFLRRGRSARRPVILLGHSEGTRIAPMIAERVPVQGLVLLGAMGRRLDELMRYQTIDRDFAVIQHLDVDGDGYLSRKEAMVSIGVYLMYASIEGHQSGRVSLEAVHQYLEARFERMPQSAQGRSAWYQGHLRLAPNLEALPRYRGPILICQGEDDDFTPLSEASLLGEALRQAGHQDFEVKAFPGLGHDFSKPLAAMMPSAGPIEPQVLDYVTSWARTRWQNN